MRESLLAEHVPGVIAFYLPQFHPIPENDAWWGKGFIEWTNVVKAKPLFRVRCRPHLLADLGFYDSRLPETRQAQANLARQFDPRVIVFSA
jgi:lipopolysaccharide biosynthesis protein